MLKQQIMQSPGDGRESDSLPRQVRPFRSVGPVAVVPYTVGLLLLGTMYVRLSVYCVHNLVWTSGQVTVLTRSNAPSIPKDPCMNESQTYLCVRACVPHALYL